MPDSTMRELITRTMQRVDDGSARMLIRANLSAMMEILDKADYDVFDEEEGWVSLVPDPPAGRGYVLTPRGWYPREKATELGLSFDE